MERPVAPPRSVCEGGCGGSAGLCMCARVWACVCVCLFGVHLQQQGKASLRPQGSQGTCCLSTLFHPPLGLCHTCAPPPLPVQSSPLPAKTYLTSRNGFVSRS